MRNIWYAFETWEQKRCGCVGSFTSGQGRCGYQNVGKWLLRGLNQHTAITYNSSWETDLHRMPDYLCLLHP
jgi:hypothetical protein